MGAADHVGEGGAAAVSPGAYCANVHEQAGGRLPGNPIVAVSILEPMPTTSHPIRGGFVTTDWSLVGRLRGPDGASALAALCEQYWFPLYAYVRRKVGNEHDARDLTQAFFAWLLEKNLLRRAAAERGRLRSFLLTSLQNFLCNEFQSRRRQIRGGDAAFLSLDFQKGEAQFVALPTDEMTAELLFERSWALLLLERVMSQLQREMEAAGEGRRFQLLKPTLSGDQSEAYREIARKLNMTEAAIRQAASRLRKRFRKLLLDEVQGTVADAEDVADEIHRLFQALAPRNGQPWKP
jgi:DNA-directed RNA polymerase specialized sigma24 family protein